MRTTTIVLSALLLSALHPTARAQAQCVLSCAAECKQEATMCSANAGFQARTDKFACESDGATALLDCESTSLDDRDLCVGSCGDELKSCLDAAKTAFKACKDGVKADLDACKADVAQTAADDRASCASDNTDCMDSCSGGVQ